MSKKAIIIGAGITGLSAGWKLSEGGYQVEIIERNDYIGGMSSTFKHKDYYLDYGPHKIFTVMDHIMEEIKGLFQDETLLSIEKRSRIRLKGKYFSYPVGLKDIFSGMGVGTGISCGLGYIRSIIRNMLTSPQDDSYEDWVVNRFGRPTYELVLGPYAQKIWGNPKELSKELAETRIAIPNLMEMLKQMLFGRKGNSPVISADVFYYPRDGFIELSERMAKKILNNGGKIELGKSIKKIESDETGAIRKLIFSDGSSESVDENDVIISTIPLSIFINSLGTLINESIKKAVLNLKNRKLILLYVVLDKQRLTEDNWLFFPERKYLFNRVFEQKGFNQNMIPEDRTVLCVEITCGADDSIWFANDDKIFAEVHTGLSEAGLVDDKVIEYFAKRLDNAYPIYDLNYKENLHFVMNRLDVFSNLYSVGRQGCYSYAGMADCMDMGISTAKFIMEGNNKLTDWPEYRKKFYNYLVVD
ncbi:MAG: hypothetical protein VR69_14825 [Peptococcaceae bacterium BRH_c4b]|nr:MAG: hypothetical protein VR69_14825 [Peptococcaceae bacterium BRH_c4b]